MEMSMPDEIAEWLVNGGPKPKVEPRYFHCSVERKHPNGCGPEGKRWEPIPPAPDTTDSTDAANGNESEPCGTVRDIGKASAWNPSHTARAYPKCS